MYHTRALHHVRRVLSDDTAKSIACSIVMSKLDYCNSLLHGAPKTTIDKLQRAQNVLARVVTQSGSRSSAAPLLRQLHWLPIRQRINYKLAVLAYKVQTTSAPDYLCTTLQLHHRNRSLRSSSAPLFAVPFTRTEIGKRAFRVSAPTVWNRLPNSVRLSDSLAVFKRRLKTSLFNSVFDGDSVTLP